MKEEYTFGRRSAGFRTSTTALIDCDLPVCLLRRPRKRSAHRPQQMGPILSPVPHVKQWLVECLAQQSRRSPRQGRTPAQCKRKDHYWLCVDALTVDSLLRALDIGCDNERAIQGLITTRHHLRTERHWLNSRNAQELHDMGVLIREHVRTSTWSPRPERNVPHCSCGNGR